jgi:methyltransferase (TIGR00027 family)
VGVDLSLGWRNALQQAGFEPGQSTVWLMEGLLFYLPEEVVLRLFDVITELSVIGSWLGCEIKNSDMLISPSTRTWIKALEEEGVPWISSIDNPEAFLAAYGWNATVVQPGEDGANFGRWPFQVVPRHVPGIPRTFFITAMRDRS